MIEVKCLASGSKGNSYAVDDGESVLLLEAGIPAKKILLGYLRLLPQVAGCLITHEHQDHAKGAAGLAARGMDLYATEGTFTGVESHLGVIDRPYRKHMVHVGEQFRLASWIVLPFETKHDAAEPCGYLLYSTKAREKLLFATDTYYIPNMFKSLNVIMVECNYSLPILKRNIRNGLVSESMEPRLLRSHFGLENVLDFFKVNDMRPVRQIYLIHISNSNGDSQEFRRAVERAAGKPVTVF